MINGTQKVSSSNSTPYKVGQNFDIKQFLNRHLMVIINTMKGNIHKILRSVRCKKKKRKNMSKKTIIQYNIYVVRQFSYVHGVVEILLFSEKNTRCSSIVISLKNDIKLWSPKQQFFYPVHRVHNGLQSAKPSFYGLNLRKSPIKNRNNIISNRVIIRIKHN